MNLIDVVIILLVVVLLSAIIYFKIIKTKGQIGCNCSLKSSCNLKIETIESIFNDIKKDFQES